MRGNPNFKSKWNHSPTIAIRVPEIFAKELLETARRLDNAKAESNKKKDSTPLSGRQLAKRLGVGETTIRKWKTRSNFTQWTKKHDPEGKEWIYVDGAFNTV